LAPAEALVPGSARNASVPGKIFKLSADHLFAIEHLPTTKQPEVGSITAGLCAFSLSSRVTQRAAEIVAWTF